VQFHWIVILFVKINMARKEGSGLNTGEEKKSRI
jgi:hypothetical protein